MKKSYIILLITLFLICVGIGFYLYKNNSNEKTNYDSQRLSSSNSTNTKPTTETEISNFSTKIYTKEKDRQNNIEITCNTLNDTVVPNGSTFSFCDTVGKATSSKGYKEADVFQDGEVIQALGGGNCQVSTTLYNAILNIDGLEIIERHTHSNSVPYIEQGKDAAVSYGSYDFKFKNNLRNRYKNKSIS